VPCARRSTSAPSWAAVPRAAAVAGLGGEYRPLDLRHLAAPQERPCAREQERLLGTALETVDHVRAEVGNVLRVRALLTGDLTANAYVAAVRAVDDLGVVVHETDTDALERAARLAAARMLRFYDALVVDRVLQRDLTLLTSDARLTRAVSGLLSTELLDGIST
jgi:predicted nucleic acid-binding protein